MGPGAPPKLQPPGHGNFRPAETAQQGAHQIIRGANLPGQLLGGPGGMDAAAVDLHRVAVDGADLSAQLLQNLQAAGHIGNLGNVFNTAGAVHHQGGGNNGNSGVFCAGDLYFTKQGFSTLYNIFCQSTLPSLQGTFFCGGKPCCKDSLPGRCRFIPAERLRAGENHPGETHTRSLYHIHGGNANHSCCVSINSKKATNCS